MEFLWLWRGGAACARLSAALGLMGRASPSLPLGRSQQVLVKTNSTQLQPDNQLQLGLRYYRRLLQMGVNNAELWNNIGLCCFDSSQYDLSLSCFERALGVSGDDNTADVWFNIGQVAIRIGDLSLAYQAFKIAVSVDRNHSESFCNLGVLDLRKNDVEAAQAMFATAHTLAPWSFEPCFNMALLCFKRGNLEGAYDAVKKSLELFPEHSDSAELKHLISNALFGMR